MKRNLIKLSTLICILLLLFACNDEERTPEQQERDEIIAVENLLRGNYWSFIDMSVSIQVPALAPPLLVNVADEE